MWQRSTRTASTGDELARFLKEAESIRGVSLWKDAWRRLRRNVAAMVSLTLLLAIFAASLLTPLLPLQSPVQQDVRQRQFLAPSLEPVKLGLVSSGESAAEAPHAAEAAGSPVGPGLAQQGSESERFARRVQELWHHPGLIDRWMIRARAAWFGDWCIPSICGTDELGRDVLSRLFWGARVSLIVGIVAALVSLLIGVSYGAVAGYVGGRIDDAMMRLVDVLYSVPFIFVVIFIIMILNEDAIKTDLARFGINQIVGFYIIIGAIYWLTMARVVRGQVISLKNEQFVDAARVIGAGQARIIFRHLVPNVLSVVIVYLTLTIPAVMLFEAFLSFLGLGVTPPDVSWGLLANQGIKVITPVKTYWWLVLFPGLALGLTLLALNFLGDGLRDALDPRMKNR